ncbi:unnamed protein product [Albugo candida]|uniref:Peptidase A1 domain-containing protein n=1 Tax=Albugo candida TaxID=65357 RepID=A0A024GGA2_9STRA|nr:unnamed protein product [Albugo candida]|eukprot:CCI45558.1 unnamed protein product [Albugo candida]
MTSLLLKFSLLLVFQPLEPSYARSYCKLGVIPRSERGPREEIVIAARRSKKTRGKWTPVVELDDNMEESKHDEHVNNRCNTAAADIDLTLCLGLSSTIPHAPNSVHHEQKVAELVSYVRFDQLSFPSSVNMLSFEWTQSDHPRLYFPLYSLIHEMSNTNKEQIYLHDLHNQIFITKKTFGASVSRITVIGNWARPELDSVTIYDYTGISFNYGTVISTIDENVYEDIKTEVLKRLQVQDINHFECRTAEQAELPIFKFRLGYDGVEYEFTSKQYIVRREDGMTLPAICFLALEPHKKTQRDMRWLIGATFAERYATKIWLKEEKFGFVPYNQVRQGT